MLAPYANTLPFQRLPSGSGSKYISATSRPHLVDYNRVDGSHWDD